MAAIKIALLIMMVTIAGCRKNLSWDNQELTEKQELKQAALTNVELGLNYLAQGENNLAKSRLVHALQLAPRLTEVHSGLAYFYEMVAQLKEAEQHHLKAIAFSENKGAVYNNYGAFLCRQGKLKQADNAFSKAISDNLYDNAAEVFENKALCALKAKDSTGAQENFKIAIKRDPNRKLAYLELAKLYYEQNNLNLASNYLQLHKKFNNLNQEALYIGYKINKSQGNRDMAASYALQLKNFYPNSQQYQLVQQDE